MQVNGNGAGWAWEQRHPEPEKKDDPKGQSMSDTGSTDDKTRRDFLYISTAAVGAVGSALAMWPFIDVMNPSADTLALSTTEVDLAPIEEGQSITVVWRGKPVFIRYRTQAEIKAARAVSLDDLIDPQADKDRTQKPQWLIMVGICTHLGFCVRPSAP